MVFFKSSRLFNVGVHYLDDNKSYFQMKAKALGKELFECICQLLGLEERDYFGLQFIDRNGNLAWLDNEKSLQRQIWHLKNRELLFRVKFYITDPSTLANEYTRYLFALQIGIDLKTGFITGLETDLACMISYVLQADLGDYDEENVANIDLAGSLPECNDQIEEQTMAFYKQNQGMLKSEADLKLLEKARKMPSYGKRFYPCESSSFGSNPLCICTDHVGISIHEDDVEVAVFAWESIHTVSFKKRKLTVLYTVFGQKKESEFVFEDANKCRAYWKIVWENLSFYKDVIQQKNKRVGRSSLFKRGSRFRYSGRTLTAMMRLDTEKPLQSFERTHSNRISMNRPARKTYISTPSKETCKDLLNNDHNLDWSRPLITEQEIDDIHGACFGDLLCVDNTLEQSVPEEDPNVRPIKRFLPMTDPMVNLSSKRSMYLSSATNPRQELNSSRPMALNRVASRGSMWSKRRLVKSSQSEIPRIYEIITELYSAEKVLCEELTAIGKYFRNAVENVLTEPRLDEFTASVVSLMEQHVRLKSLLTTSLDQIHVEKLLSYVSLFFVEIFDSFYIYEQYLSSCDVRMRSLMAEMAENGPFSTECAIFESQMYSSVIRLFLRPIQQLYYYQLILDAISGTSMTDENHDLFNSMSTKLSCLLEKNDSRIQNTFEMICLYELASFIDESDFIVGNNQKLVRMGVLKVNSSERLAVLLSDVIVFCEPVSGLESFSLTNKQNLRNLEKVNVENGCFFVLRNGIDELLVETQTIEDKHSWVADINNLLVDFSDFSEEEPLGNLDSVHFPRAVLSIIWKYRICSLGFSDLFNFFKVTFSGPVSRQTKLSKQRFFIVLNNLCLYFFTDYYSTNGQALPECKHVMCILSSEISMSSVPGDDETGEKDKYQFIVKVNQTTMTLITESRYYQNRWAVSIESLSV